VRSLVLGRRGSIRKRNDELTDGGIGSVRHDTGIASPFLRQLVRPLLYSRTTRSSRLGRFFLGHNRQVVGRRQTLEIHNKCASQRFSFNLIETCAEGAASSQTNVARSYCALSEYGSHFDPLFPYTSVRRRGCFIHVIHIVPSKESANVRKCPFDPQRERWLTRHGGDRVVFVPIPFVA
jgi:hypothetical protein